MKFQTLGNKYQIPALGLGTWKSKGNEVARAVIEALEIGYRHIDCAPIYKNEKIIGPALAQVMQQRGIKREELWLTSKLWNNAHAPRHVRPALERTLKDLRLDYLDLYLIHWPVSFRQDIEFPRRADEFLQPDEIPIGETWQAMEKMVKKGLCRCIGVCNFSLRRLQTLTVQASIVPAVNQVEMHPFLQQHELLDYCRANHIVMTAYSPLGSPDRPEALRKEKEPHLLSHPTVIQISQKLGVTPAQILLSWGLLRNSVVIPKSVSPKRLLENFQAQYLKIEPDDLHQLNNLDCGYRYVDGDFFCGPASPYTLSTLWK